MYIELFDIERNNCEKLSEKLFIAMNKKYGGSDKDAYKFIVPFLRLFYGRALSFKALSEIITDCTADGGLDAFYFNNGNYIDIFDFKSKNGISDKELEKLRISFEKYIFNRSASEFIGDEALESNVKKIFNKSNGGKKFRLIIVRKKLPYTREKLFDKNKKYGSDKIRNIIKIIESKNIEVAFVDIESMFVNKFNEEIKLGSITLPVEKDLFQENKKGTRSVIIKINVDEILMLVNKYDLKIFSNNVREYLGKKKFSEKIMETLKKYPSIFHLLHNGIIMTSRKIDACLPNAGYITVSNPQIVNGAQSVYGLYQEYKNGKISKKETRQANFICKIIEADDEFTKKICETSNTQNAVKNEDLRSNDHIQIYLEKYIQVKSGGNYKYKRKRGRIEKNSISSVKLFQWVYASMLEKPASAKNNRQYLFDLVTTKGKYMEISEEIKKKIKDVWRLCEIALFVENKIKNENGKKRSLLKHMDLHIVAGLFHLRSSKDTDFNKIYKILYKYYKNEKAKHSRRGEIMNENKIFTKAKNESTWNFLKSKI